MEEGNELVLLASFWHAWKMHAGNPADFSARQRLLLKLPRHADEKTVPLFIGCQLGMEGRCQDISLTHRDNKLVTSRCGKPGERLHCRPDSGNDRRTNKNDRRR